MGTDEHADLDVRRLAHGWFMDTDKTTGKPVRREYAYTVVGECDTETALARGAEWDRTVSDRKPTWRERMKRRSA